MKVIIAGSREFNNYMLLSEKCDLLLSQQSKIEIVSGTAKGADKLGERYAQERGYSVKQFPADWGKYGKSAGYQKLKNKLCHLKKKYIGFIKEK